MAACSSIGPSACFWALTSDAMPAEARSSRVSSSARLNGSRSAVPWTSTRPPSPVMTTFMSVSARTSSSYGRSRQGVPSTIPTLTAATWSRSGNDLTRFSCISRWLAANRAAQAPVMEAQRVPPSAWRTSQSTHRVDSPNALVSVTARRERPIRRWISWVRPPGRPLATSRPDRSPVAPGSMAYSEVTQPLPLPRRNGGTRSS